MVGDRPRCHAAQKQLIDSGIDRAFKQAPLERRANIAGFVQFLSEPGPFVVCGIGCQFIMAFAAIHDFRERGFCRHHPGFHCSMAAFDARHV